MAKWHPWTKVSDGPYRGKPTLSGAGLGVAAYSTQVRDLEGNLIVLNPANSGQGMEIENRGGAGMIAHPPIGHWWRGGFAAVGNDRRLYHLDWKGGAFRWSKIKGPGKFLSSVYSSTSMDGWWEILGEGTEHQLAHALFKAEQNGNQKVKRWNDLGQPGERGGKKGINGSPAVSEYGEEMHVLVRGQDNHLWHITGKLKTSGKRSFSKWTNLGGGLSQAPVVIRNENRLECFVVGEKQELYVNTWDGKRWSGFQELGGQLKGLPAAVSVWESDMTYVFGRGVHDKLWYRRRTGTTWQRWQAVGDGLTSNPAAWIGAYNFSGGAFVTCEVLRQNGELWARSLQLTANEYTGTKVTRKKGSVQYTLQRGDWLYRLARALSVDVNLIKKANRQITDFDQLDAGTKLTIPVIKHNNRVPYIVQQGDTVGRIANAFSTTVAGIVNANSIQDANAIDAGITLKIPVN